jgi:hypothetical protein
VDIRSRANTTRGLDFEHMVKARAHKGGVRIGKTPKKLYKYLLRFFKPSYLNILWIIAVKTSSSKITVFEK